MWKYKLINRSREPEVSVGGSMKYYRQKRLGSEETIVDGTIEHIAATSSILVILDMFFSRNREKEATTQAGVL